MVAEPCQAGHDERIFADKFVIQYAGMLGMVSLGVENTTGSHSDYQLLAGYTPASAAGIDIYSVGARANYVFDPLLDSKHGTARFYTGIGFYYYFRQQYQSYKYPVATSTHPATEWHLMPYLGVRISGMAPENAASASHRWE